MTPATCRVGTVLRGERKSWLVAKSGGLHGVIVSFRSRSLWCLFLALGLVSALHASKSEFSGTLVIEVEAAAADLEKAVQEVTTDQIIHGTFSFEKEKTLYGAHRQDSSTAFHASPGPGKAFYKAAENVLAPKYFKDSGDIGTITVRYVVQSVSATRSTLQIDAVFIDARNQVHPSQGNVESSEYAVIKDHLQELQDARQQIEVDAQEMARKRKEYESTREALAKKLAQAGAPGARDSTLEELEISVASLRRQVERRVRISGTELKAAPFKSSATLENLKPQTEIVVLILTQYWYGVETDDGHHGWVRRSEVEPLP